MVGISAESRISNSYAQEINFNASNTRIANNGVGGIVGNETGAGFIQYCYTTGNIRVNLQHAGGIYGRTAGTTRNSYSLVNVQSTTDLIGGIGGFNIFYAISEAGNTSYYYGASENNLYLGNIYSAKTSSYVNRIAGSQSNTAATNYAYEGQLVNGRTSTEELGATLISKTEIFNRNTYLDLDKLDFADNFDYSGLLSEILPKLYYDGTTTLLPNQKDLRLERQGIYMESVMGVVVNYGPDWVEAIITINNPSAIAIEEVVIEHMDVTITGQVNSGGKSNISIHATPNKYYDNYKITGFVYDGLEYEVTGEEYRLQRPDGQPMFYKEITNRNEWQEMSDAQNYRVTVDLDFTGYTGIVNTNFSIGRLEGYKPGGAPVLIKNMKPSTGGNFSTLNFTKQEEGLIKELTLSAKDIIFEDIEINNSATGSYAGIIIRNDAEMSNVEFKNITISATKMDQVGMIARNFAYSITNVNLDNITCKGVNNVGGFIGNTNSRVLSNINGNNINITATGNYVGGIFGYVTDAISIYSISNLTVENSVITGASYTGAVMGLRRRK